jgi:hypothetical protein
MPDLPEVLEKPMAAESRNFWMKSSILVEPPWNPHFNVKKRQYITIEIATDYIP